jgi:FKBP-type peptidyl-prolyl cis-trans isomerase FkpA
MCYSPWIAHFLCTIVLSLVMRKFRYILILLCLAAGFTACKKSSNSNFDVAAQLAADTTAIRAYIVKNNIPAIKHESGIFYQIIAPGNGNVEYKPSTIVNAHYSGRVLGSTTTFDTTEGKAPVDFALGGVITGWQIGVPLIQEGGTIRLIIPSYYGYGNRGTGPIPANSILDFNITLVDVN